MSLYKSPVLEKIIDTIRDNTNRISEYYYGDPFLIPRSNLPALILAKDSTGVQTETTSEDRHELRVVATLVTDIRNDFARKPSNIVAGTNQLYKIMEERKADYTLKDNTLLYIIRNNADLDSNLFIDLGTVTEADYGLVLGKRGEESISTEANLSFTVNFYQER